ncbi:MAG: hypothetical protein CMK59_03430 [Proteobacteria bacterium]|nr:hypothetical protein [Pseudomonadota bacterium]
MFCLKTKELKVNKSFSSSFAMMFLIFTGCGEGNQNTTTVDCESPKAQAGEDQTSLLGEAVTLDGLSSEWCSSRQDEGEYHWSFVAIPADSAVTEQSLSDNKSSTASAPKFLPDVSGEYLLSLVIELEEYSSDVDYVVVSVEAGGNAPVASCGGDDGFYSGEIGSVVTLDGTESSDTDGTIRTYDWFLTPPACSSEAMLLNAQSAEPSFVPDCGGIYVASLQVSDGGLWSEQELCTVEVASDNGMPVANAGQSKVLSNCVDSEIELNGYASYDPDGDPLSFQWTVVEVPNGSPETLDISSLTSIDPVFTYSDYGNYIFELQVSDGVESSAPDVVSIDIGSPENNTPPSADAGELITVDLKVNCDSALYGSGCAPCPATDVVLNGTGSEDVDADSLSFMWSALGHDLEIGNPSSSMADLTLPSRNLSSPSQVISESYSFELEVSDCNSENSDTSQVTVSYTCRRAQ